MTPLHPARRLPVFTVPRFFVPRAAGGAWRGGGARSRPRRVAPRPPRRRRRSPRRRPPSRPVRGSVTAVTASSHGGSKNGAKKRARPRGDTDTPRRGIGHRGGGSYASREGGGAALAPCCSPSHPPTHSTLRIGLESCTYSTYSPSLPQPLRLRFWRRCAAACHSATPKGAA